MREPLFSERDADKEVIVSSLETNSLLWRELERTRAMLESEREQYKRSQDNIMLIRSYDGKVYRVEDAKLLSADEVAAETQKLQAELAVLQGTPANGDQNSGQTQPAPAAPADGSQPAPAADNSTPAAPVTDPNQAPVPPADPNAAQPAVDQSQVVNPGVAQPDPNAVPPLQ